MPFAIDDGKINRLIAQTGGKKYAKNILNNSRLNLKDFLAIISVDETDKDFFEELASKAQKLTRTRFGCVKGLYIPLYLSSSCHNVCSYCGFSKNNRVKRKTLNENEIRDELCEIYGKGFKNILLVSGELENFKNIEYLNSAVCIAKELGFHSIGVELGALDEPSASLLAKSGAQCFVLYQETYHQNSYKKTHLAGQKTDYDFRIDGAERAIRSGFRQVTLGFLAGLYDPHFDSSAFYEHLHYLKKKHWDIEFSISLPRLRRAYGMDNGFEIISDVKYAQILMGLRLAFPDAPINLSTRESARFRDGMANICATHLSVESKTTPGGYAREVDGLEQFSVSDDRNIDELSRALNAMGYDVHFKDWEIELNRQNGQLEWK
ncbi:MAG: thiamine biosynthesis protein ThiH [bacterium]|nr:MAG: thiamine biosynthesis protein ThiH [bacterium]